jgi:hypothetical protein
MSTKVSTLPTEQGDQPKVHTFDTEDPNVSLVNHGIESNIDAKKLDDTNREGNGILGGSRLALLKATWKQSNWQKWENSQILRARKNTLKKI